MTKLLPKLYKTEVLFVLLFKGNIFSSSEESPDFA